MTNIWRTAQWVVGVWVSTGVLGAIGATIKGTGPVARFFGNLLDPALLLAIGVGTSALIAFFGVLSATKTFRSAIATSLTIVFFGLLLMPPDYRAQTSEQFNESLIWAWTLTIAFYFGTEGAVQAIKVRQVGSAPPAYAEGKTTDTADGPWPAGDGERVEVTPPSR